MNDDEQYYVPTSARLAQRWRESSQRALANPGLCDGLYYVIFPAGKIRGQFLVTNGSVIACDPPDLRDGFHVHLWHSHRVDPAPPWEAPPKT